LPTVCGLVAGALYGVIYEVPLLRQHPTEFALFVVFGYALIGGLLFRLLANPLAALIVLPIREPDRIIRMGSNVVLAIPLVLLAGMAIEFFQQQPSDTSSLLFTVLFSGLMIFLWALLRYRQSRLAALALAIIFGLFLIGMVATVAYNVVSKDLWGDLTAHLLLFLTTMLIPSSLAWIAIRVFVATSKLHTSAENPESTSWTESVWAGVRRLRLLASADWLRP